MRANLFIVGAMKCGTTALADYLSQHDAVAVADPKEPCYFVDPADLRIHWPAVWRLGLWKDEQRYLALFRAGAQTRYLCEASTLYAKRPDIDGVVQAIARHNPDARFIYVMRDPAERAISHYWHEYRIGAETRTMAEAIWAHESPYRNYGRYAYQLKPYLQTFGAQRIYTLASADLQADPVGTISAICAWLGLAPPAPSALAPRRSHRTPAVVENPALYPPIYRALRADLLNPIKRCVPAELKTRMKIALGGATFREAADTAQIDADLRAFFEPELRELEKRVGKRFPQLRASVDPKPAEA